MRNQNPLTNTQLYYSFYSIHTLTTTLLKSNNHPPLTKLKNLKTFLFNKLLFTLHPKTFFIKHNIPHQLYNPK